MLYHAPSNSLLFKVNDPLYVRELIPHSKIIPHEKYNIAIKHTLEATRILHNVGINVHSPIRYQYRWPGRFKPYKHQIVMAEKHIMHRRLFNLSEMGTMKTASTLWAADWLMETGRVKKALILSPLSTLERVWKSDIFATLMHRSAVVVHGKREQREFAINQDVDFYILNHDGLNLSWLTEVIKRRKDIDLVIVDEASMFRNAGTRKYKALEKMLRPDQRLWLLTGTPCPNAPTDAWALARLVSPSRVPRFFGSFRRQTMVQVSPFKWAPRTGAYRDAFEAMQPAVRFRKKDCIDLPPLVFEDRQCQLTSEQRDAYDEMKNEMKLELKTGSITAVNAADKINKLRQIFCGVVKDPKTGLYVDLDHKPRTQVLLECIEQSTSKALVIVPFKGIIQSLQTEVSPRFSNEILNGDVPYRQRNKIIERFKTEPDPHTLLCHPKVMAHGLNLTEADTLIFYGPIYSNDEFLQVIERFNRAGQTKKMTVIRMAAHPLEWAIYKMVDNRRLNQDNILKLYRKVVE